MTLPPAAARAADVGAPGAVAEPERAVREHVEQRHLVISHGHFLCTYTCGGDSYPAGTPHRSIKENGMRRDDIATVSDRTSIEETKTARISGTSTACST